MRLSPVLDALRFHGGSTAGLARISDLSRADEQGLTLPLGVRCHDALPQLVRERIDRNLADNATRHLRLVESYREIAETLRAACVEFAVLKGLTRQPYYCADLKYRPSYDLDLYCPDIETAGRAQAVLAGLGYGPVHGNEEADTDHLPRLVKKTGWTWKGNYFDPEMPLAVEVHFQFWDESGMRFNAGDTGGFWQRRVIRDVAGMMLPALSAGDALSYAVLHVVRHLLRGALKLHHVYEMAHFLETSRGDDGFWNGWAANTCDGIAFRLAGEWFQCEMHPRARAAVAGLQADVRWWFEAFGNSPALIAGNPNKNEIWLHRCLVSCRTDRRAVTLKRLFPARHGRVVLNPHAVGRGGVRDRLYALWFLGRRAAFHVATIVTMVPAGLRWLRLRRQPAGGTSAG